MSTHPAREHLLEAILNSTEDAVISISLDGTIETWSAGAQRLYGYTAQEVTGQSLRRLLPLFELPSTDSLFSAPSGNGHSVMELEERLHKDGSRILLATRRTRIRNEGGEVEGILETSRKIDLHEPVLSAEAALPLLLEQVPGLLWTTDRNLQIVSHWGAGFASPNSKIRPGSLVGQSVSAFLRSSDAHATPLAEHYAALQGVSSHFEFTLQNCVVEIRVVPLHSAHGEITGCIAAAVDISGHKKTEEQALYQARHDALTGLANYREFMDCLERELLRAERSHRYFTLLLLDLDDLKRINDLQGHLAGNRALRRLAAAMKEHCRATDLAARYGGDEFAVVLIDSDQGMAQHVAERIEYRLRTDLEKPSLSASIGIGVYPDDGRTPAELIEAADQRLYRSKKSQSKRSVSAP